MSANNAHRTAAVVATNHPVPTTVAGASFAYGAAGKDDRAAVPGTAIHNAVNVVARNVQAAVGVHTTTQHCHGAQLSAAFVPGDTPFANGQVAIGAPNTAGQPSLPHSHPDTLSAPPPTTAASDVSLVPPPDPELESELTLLLSVAVNVCTSDGADLDDEAFRAVVDHRRVGAVPRTWKGPGKKVHGRPKSHTLTPDDWQDIDRYIYNRYLKCGPLLQAEALRAFNKAAQQRFLSLLRKADMAKPPEEREAFVTGAELAAKYKAKAEREARWRKRATIEATDAVADAFFPTSLSPDSVAAENTVTGVLKRKRSADEEPAHSEDPPAKRARVEQEQEPQPRCADLVNQDVAPLPDRPRGYDAATHPEPLPYYGAAAYPILQYTSDVATQTPSPPLRIRVVRPLSIATPCTPSPRNAKQSVQPMLVDGRRHVRFAAQMSYARPERSEELPEADKIGADDESDYDEPVYEAQQRAYGAFSKSDWKTLDMPTLELKALDRAPSNDPTVRHTWTHPVKQYVVYQDASTQYELPSPDATTA